MGFASQIHPRIIITMPNIKTNIDSTQSVESVRAQVLTFLSLIPKRFSHILHQSFYRINMITPEGNKFVLVIQGSELVCCDPPHNLPNLSLYNSVELGIIPDKTNTDPLFRCGTMWDNGLRRVIEPGEMDWFSESGHGLLMPSHLGFTRVQDIDYDDTLGCVPVNDLVADLADFFIRGGVIDMEHEDTKIWIEKIQEIKK